MIKILEGQGYSMTFHNNWTVSVMFGPLNNCSNKRVFAKMMTNLRNVEEAMQRSGSEGCVNAEVAVFAPASDTPAEGYPKGFQTSNEVAAILAEIAAK